MRLKLVFLTSLLGALLGSGGPLLITAIGLSQRGFLLAKSFPETAEGWKSGTILLIPIAVALFAGVFVYRHTARRRKLQAVLTSVLVLMLSAVAFVGVICVINFP
jgi:hypothetical protein